MQLGASKKAVVRQFKGKTLVDIREYYTKDGKELPGKKVGKVISLLHGNGNGNDILRLGGFPYF